ncbi:TOG array regulator of axonemal microtubules protein 1-like [Brachyhypopomus gauderio]|uniref:TOG array regulator of axonemal microtubules protein 1-like n=1 Tax=Brachyhypopomus gauderio TaxID=698409 RepID=UPI0040430F15
MRDSPLQHPISSSKQLEMIEREQRQLQAVRVQKVKNLRSKVSCAAMTTLAYMFTYLRRAMDPEAAETARVLLHKACESSAFIREDVDLALSAMVHSCSARRSIHALLAGGLSHRNATVRKTTAFHMESLAQLLGASKLLTGKDLTERFLSAISRLALDAAQEVRFHARSCIKFLATNKDFFKMVDKFVSPKDRWSVKDIIMKGR